MITTRLVLGSLPPPDSPASVGWFILIFSGLMAGLYYTLETFKSFRASPATKTALVGQPLVVKAEERFASWEEQTKLQHRVDCLYEEIRSGFDRLDQKRSVSIAGVHELVRLQGERLAAISTASQIQGEDLQQLKSSLAEVNTRIDMLPQRTISLLRETKGLI